MSTGTVRNENYLVAQEREARKRTWRRSPHKRTLRSRLWDRTGLRGKTFWDWLQLLVVPLVLVVVGLWFTAQQEARQQLELEARRAEEARALEERRIQNAALQSYLDAMSQLILEENLRDLEEVSEEVQTLARVRTITVLSSLDPSLALLDSSTASTARRLQGACH